MRRLLVAATLLALGGVAGAGACGFPEVSFAESTEAGEDATVDGASVDPTAEAGNDAKSDAAAPPDAAEILIDGSSPDALIVKDAGMAIDAAGCAPTDCDCDLDGYKDTLKAGCNMGANDCDDSDSRSHPMQGFLEDEAKPPQLGDWDCSGAAEPLYATNVTCAGLSLGLGCSKIFGFEDLPQCGKTGSFIQCTGSLLDLGCKVGTREMRKQPCK